MRVLLERKKGLQEFRTREKESRETQKRGGKPFLSNKPPQIYTKRQAGPYLLSLQLLAHADRALQTFILSCSFLASFSHSLRLRNHLPYPRQNYNKAISSSFVFNHNSTTRSKATNFVNRQYLHTLPFTAQGCISKQAPQLQLGGTRWSHFLQQKTHTHIVRGQDHAGFPSRTTCKPPANWAEICVPSIFPPHLGTYTRMICK